VPQEIHYLRKDLRGFKRDQTDKEAMEGKIQAHRKQIAKIAKIKKV
jgi:hypothetical protein